MSCSFVVGRDPWQGPFLRSGLLLSYRVVITNPSPGSYRRGCYLLRRILHRSSSGSRLSSSDSQEGGNALVIDYLGSTGCYALH
jgi:hypothetical protein